MEKRTDVPELRSFVLAILQADLTTDVRVINKIVNTAKAAGFDHLLFAANKK